MYYLCYCDLGQAPAMMPQGYSGHQQQQPSMPPGLPGAQMMGGQPQQGIHGQPQQGMHGQPPAMMQQQQQQQQPPRAKLDPNMMPSVVRFVCICCLYIYSIRFN